MTGSIYLDPAIASYGLVSAVWSDSHADPEVFARRSVCIIDRMDISSDEGRAKARSWLEHQSVSQDMSQPTGVKEHVATIFPSVCTMQGWSIDENTIFSIRPIRLAGTHGSQSTARTGQFLFDTTIAKTQHIGVEAFAEGLSSLHDEISSGERSSVSPVIEARGKETFALVSFLQGGTEIGLGICIRPLNVAVQV